MPDFRKRTDLPITRLSRSNLQTLSYITTSGMEKCDFEVEVGDAVYRASSLDGLLSNQLPPFVNNLSIDAHGSKNEDKTYRSIHLTLHRSFSNCRIYSSDGIWVRGKTQQIAEFFRMHIPWYGTFLIRNFWPFTGSIYALSLYALYYLITQQNYWILSLYVFTLLCVIRIDILHWQRRLFPHTRIDLDEIQHWLNKETGMLILTAIGVLATLGLLVIEMIK